MIYPCDPLTAWLFLFFAILQILFLILFMEIRIIENNRFLVVSTCVERLKRFKTAFYRQNEQDHQNPAYPGRSV